MKTIWLATAALTAAAFSFPLYGQNDKPFVLGDFENSGSITTGYRFTDVSGYKPKYQELFDLDTPDSDQARYLIAWYPLSASHQKQ